jgi:hypothetical protein
MVFFKNLKSKDAIHPNRSRSSWRSNVPDPDEMFQHGLPYGMRDYVKIILHQDGHSRLFRSLQRS